MVINGGVGVGGAVRWQDKAANQKFFAGEFQQFSKEAADLLLEVGILKSIGFLRIDGEADAGRARLLGQPR